MNLIPFNMGKIRKCLDDCKMGKCRFWYRQEGYCGRYFCHWCKKLVEEKSKGVRITYPMSKRTWETNRPASIIFHVDCYLEQLRLFLSHWAEKHPPKTKRMGRPRVPCSDRPLRRKLLSLQIYHMKKGNLARVEEIQVEIKRLETELV